MRGIFLASAVLACALNLPAAAGPLTLKQVYDAAWTRQPEARAADARRDALGARLNHTGAWLAAPPALEFALQSDRLIDDRGAREWEAGVALPLWLPGERAGTRRLAEADAAAFDASLAGVQLRLAASVREGWWALARAQAEHALAEARLTRATALATDVARRVRAGDLARADGHQADAAVARARSEFELADARLAEAATPFVALGLNPDHVLGTPEPDPGATGTVANTHPALREAAAAVERARQAQTLAGVRTRDNPELKLATTRGREAGGEPDNQTLTLGLRLPFGRPALARAQRADAQAERAEAEARFELARARIEAGIAAAQRQLAASLRARDAAAERARLAVETRGFYDKAFRLGEADLPTHLRVAAEADEATRDAARAEIDAAAAQSALRQALGLLPE